MKIIDANPDDQRLGAARNLYAEKWGENSKNIEHQQGYEWMASLLRPCNPQRILDIGCGTGSGLMALLEEFPSSHVASLEENPVLIAIAKGRLEKAGKSVSVVKRLRDRHTGPRSHELTYITGRLKIGSKAGEADLIESDMLEDPEFEEFLVNEKKFDAITVWLVGSHALRYSECDFHRGQINTPDQYRWQVQAAAFSLAVRFLRLGGIVQIVDRGPAPHTQEKKNQVLKMPNFFISHLNGTMAISGLDYLSYRESTDHRALKMVNSIGGEAEHSDMALISVTSVKVK